jgi:UDP-glucose 4-epimerase
MIDGKSVLLVGGAGLVGSHIVEQLLGKDVAEIRILDNFTRGQKSYLENALRDPRVRLFGEDMCDRSGWDRWLEGVDAVYHLAALWLLQCVEQPRACLEVNVVGTFDLIEACQRHGVSKVVYSSSASVYGDAVQTPMTEEHPFHNRTMYGASKIAGEQFFRAFYESHGLDYVGLRYMNIYGPRQDYRGAYVSVIMKVLDRLDQGLPPIIYGDGEQSYDFIYVEDVARANVLALESDATDVFLNIGSGIRTTINELVALLLELTDSDLRPEYRPQAQSFVTHRVGSTDLARERLGFEASVPLRQGLQRLISWRQAQLASSR